MHNGFQNPLNSNRSQTFPFEMIQIVDPSGMEKFVKLRNDKIKEGTTKKKEEEGEKLEK